MYTQRWTGIHNDTYISTDIDTHSQKHTHEVYKTQNMYGHTGTHTNICRHKCRQNHIDLYSERHTYTETFRDKHRQIQRHIDISTYTETYKDRQIYNITHQEYTYTDINSERHS